MPQVRLTDKLSTNHTRIHPRYQSDFDTVISSNSAANPSRQLRCLGQSAPTPSLGSAKGIRAELREIELRQCPEHLGCRMAPPPERAVLSWNWSQTGQGDIVYVPLYCAPWFDTRNSRMPSL